MNIFETMKKILTGNKEENNHNACDIIDTFQEKDPEEMIKKNLHILLWKNDSWTIQLEKKRSQYKSNFKLVTKTVTIGQEEVEVDVDFISFQLYQDLYNKKFSKEERGQKYMALKEIIKQTWWMKNGDFLNNVNDGGTLYRLLEGMWIPKGIMKSPVSSEELTTPNMFDVVIFNLNNKTFLNITIKPTGYQINSCIDKIYYAPVWLLSA